MEGIQVSVEKVGPESDISIIRVGGYIDTTTSSELERALDSLLKAGVYRVVIDLGNVDYISSAGWGIFISEIKGMRERDGDLKLARMIPDVYEVFELLEFHYILKAFDSIEEAIASFSGGKSGAAPAAKPKKIDPEPEELDPTDIDAEDDEFQESMDLLGDDVDSKIKKILQENPSWGATKVAKVLNTEKYGFVRMNSLAVWRAMRKINLDD